MTLLPTLSTQHWCGALPEFDFSSVPPIERRRVSQVLRRYSAITLCAPSSLSGLSRLPPTCLMVLDTSSPLHRITWPNHQSQCSSSYLHLALLSWPASDNLIPPLIFFLKIPLTYRSIQFSITDIFCYWLLLTIQHWDVRVGVSADEIKAVFHKWSFRLLTRG